jgi:hypothetical protein
MAAAAAAARAYQVNHYYHSLYEISNHINTEHCGNTTLIMPTGSISNALQQQTHT